MKNDANDDLRIQIIKMIIDQSALHKQQRFFSVWKQQSKSETLHKIAF